MFFKDRAEAGKFLAEKLFRYRQTDTVVYAIPRGGIVTGREIARNLNAPLDLIITRKIGHPVSPEYAVAATAENGQIVGNQQELALLDPTWLKHAVDEQKNEAKRRRKKYLQKRSPIPIERKVAILVDDGIATGLTMRVAIKELRRRRPKKIVVAVPIIPQETYALLSQEADEVIALGVPPTGAFLGAVGAYYESFPPVEDGEVITILNEYDEKLQKIAMPTDSQSMIDPTLFTFPPYNYIAKELLNVPNVTRGDFTRKRYPNRELHIKLDSHATERECVVLGSLAPPETNLVSFLFLCHTLQKENAQKITAILPFLSYTRQDKKERLQSYGTAFIGKLLAASGVDEVITIDIHSIHDKELFPIPLLSLSPAKLFADEIKKLGLTNAAIVAPDEGAKRRAKAVAKAAGMTREIAYAVKKRTSDGVRLIEFHGTVGKKAVIIDDMIDTGQTLLSVCRKLQKKGVEDITIMVTHGLFTGNAWEELWEHGVSRIYCTDTIPLPKRISDKIRVISIIPLLTGEVKKEYKDILTVERRDRYDFYDYEQP